METLHFKAFKGYFYYKSSEAVTLSHSFELAGNAEGWGRRVGELRWPKSLFVRLVGQI